MKTSLTSSREAVGVPTSPGKQIRLPPMVMRVWLEVYLIRVDLAENLGIVDIFVEVGLMSSYSMTKKVLVPLTCLPCPLGLVPMHWQSLPRSLEQD